MALTLTRRTGEAIRIGSDIVVRVVATCGQKVRLSTTAPPELKIMRAEVYDRLADATAIPDPSSAG